MTDQLVRIGPWPGGLNTRDLPEDIADNEVCEAENIIFDDMGNAMVRPPIVNCNGDMVAVTGIAHAAQEIIPVGTINNLSSVSMDTYFIFYLGLAATGRIAHCTGSINEDMVNNAWVLDYTATPGKKVVACVEYNGLIYFVGTTTGGFSGANDLTGVLTAVPNMPGTNNFTYGRAFIFKDRMWIVDMNASKIYYSKATDPTIWAAPDGGSFTIEGGSSLSTSKIVETCVIGNSIYIITSEAIWALTYSSEPTVDGFLQKIVELGNINAAVEWKGQLFVFDGTTVYRLINGGLQSVSDKINFRSGGIGERFLSHPALIITAGYLILSGDSSTPIAPEAYVMNLHTGAWSHWSPTNASSPTVIENWLYRGSGVSSTLHHILQDSAKVLTYATPFVSAGDQNVVGIDMSRIGNMYKSNVIDGNNWGAVDYRRDTATGTTNFVPVAVSLTTKKFGFIDIGKWKRFRWLRTFHQHDFKTTASHVWTMKAVLDTYSTDAPGGSTLTSATLDDKPGLVSFPSSNVRFRQVQFKWIGTQQSGGTVTKRSWAHLTGFIFKFASRDSQFKR